LRRLFNRLKNDPDTTHTEFPSLPSDLSYLELCFKTNRGFLARKIGQYLGIGEGDTIFFLSLSNISFTNSNKENEMEKILYLSEQMLKWNEQQQDISSQIKSLNVSNDFQNAMLKAYDVFKYDLFLPTVKVQEKKQDPSVQNIESEWVIYRDVIYAATQGQFLLISEEDVNKYRRGNVFCEGTIKERADIPICRNLAKDSLEKLAIQKTKIMSWLLVLSEAITNTIKHAEEGKMTLIENEDEIRFVIQDKGPGFSLKELPNTTLLAGYSTKKSMGQGFTLMMKMAKQVLLSTSPQGSTIILIFNITDGKEGIIHAAG
jgi:anti-sigma regulatory factor (Ser/Thr protein kinase)